MADAENQGCDIASVENYHMHIKRSIVKIMAFGHAFD